MDNIDNGPLPWNQILTPRTTVSLVTIGFAAGVLGKLSYDWIQEGRRMIKNAKKNSN